MQTLSLDSNVLIDLLRKGRLQVRSRYFAALVDEAPMVVSTIVLNEIRFGALMSARVEAQLDAVASLVAGKPVIDFTEQDARVSADVRADLERRGERIGGYDALIAGQALARGWTLVTANTDEFDRVRGLHVIDWTRAEA